MKYKLSKPERCNETDGIGIGLALLHDQWQAYYDQEMQRVVANKEFWIGRVNSIAEVAEEHAYKVKQLEEEKNELEREIADLKEMLYKESQYKEDCSLLMKNKQLEQQSVYKLLEALPFDYTKVEKDKDDVVYSRRMIEETIFNLINGDKK